MRFAVLIRSWGRRDEDGGGGSSPWVGLAAQSANRTEITFADGRIFPESLTHTKDGSVYFGSLGLDSVYKAGPGLARAEVWIQPKTAGLSSVLGVLADEPAGVLWVCASATGGRGGAPVVGETALKAFNLKDASLKGSYPFPGGGFCNDIAVAADGTVYVTDTFQARVLRLKKSATALDVWAADQTVLNTADGDRPARRRVCIRQLRRPASWPAFLSRLMDLPVRSPSSSRRSR